MNRTITQSMWSYLQELFQFCGNRAVFSLGLLIFQGFTRGASLLMLIPMLSFAGLTSNSGAGGNQAPLFLMNFLARTGLSLNLSFVLICYIGLVSLQALLTYYQTVLNNSIQQGFTQFLRDRMYERIAQANWLFITRTKSSDLIHILTSSIQQIGSGTFFFLSLIGTTAIVVVHLTLAFLLSPLLTGLVLMCAAAMAMLLKPMNRQALNLGKTMHGTAQEMYATITEHLGGIKVAKSFGAEKQHIDRFQRFSRSATEEVQRFCRLRAGASASSSIVAVVFISAIFYLAVEVVHIPSASLFLLVYLFSRLLPQFTTMHQNYQNIVNMLPSFNAVITMQTRCEAAAEPLLIGAPSAITLQRGVRYQNVSFQFDTRQKQFAITNLSIEIQARKMTAIVGPSGAGKTTFADLLMGLLTPSTGKIFIDDQELSDNLFHDWRRSIGYVPQDTFLFNETIRANLLWAQSDASETALHQALAMAAADDFVTGLPQGLDTVIGDRGIRLSGGERQRIALARALLRRPALLLLDEATSSLDTSNERQIQTAIDHLHGEQTLVVIAHRLSTVQRADLIIVMQEGTVTETGTWDELAGRPGSRFREMLQDDVRE